MEKGSLHERETEGASEAATVVPGIAHAALVGGVMWWPYATLTHVQVLIAMLLTPLPAVIVWDAGIDGGLRMMMSPERTTRLCRNDSVLGDCLLLVAMATPSAKLVIHSLLTTEQRQV